MPEKIGHSIDGIEEYDNPIPRWLMWLLYLSIAFSIIYWVLYPGFWSGSTGWNQDRMYADEMREASVVFASPSGGGADLKAVLADPNAKESGKDLYTQNCAPCHGMDAKGAIGPNLTDAEWVYGGEPEAIAKTISDGTAKGMPAWKSQLGSKKIAQVVAYVNSLKGK